jgi:hypothetical protein
MLVVLVVVVVVVVIPADEGAPTTIWADARACVALLLLSTTQAASCDRSH